MSNIFFQGEHFSRGPSPALVTGLCVVVQIHLKWEWKLVRGWILIRVARLLILNLAVLEAQFGRSFKRKSGLGEHGFIGH